MSIALCWTTSLAGGADVDAHAAAGAIVGRDLDRHQHSREVARSRHSLCRNVAGASSARSVEHLHPDRGVRADERALARSRCRSSDPRSGSRSAMAALLPPGGAGRERAVDGQRGDGEQVALAGDHQAVTRCTKSGALVGDRRQAAHVRRAARRAPRPRAALRARRRPRRSSARRPCGRACRSVFSIAALIARDRLARAQHVGQREEAVCMTVLMRPPSPRLARDPLRVDDEEAQPLVHDRAAGPRAGRCSHTSSARTGCSAGRSRPAPATSSTSSRSRKPN